jgi:hypothetical protein
VSISYDDNGMAEYEEHFEGPSEQEMCPRRKRMTIVWMYYETDGDAGAYNIKLFDTQKAAENYKDNRKDPYGKVTSKEIHEEGIVDPPVYQNVICPDCGGVMVSRSGKYGTFWGCRNYPECRGTRDSQGRSKADRMGTTENSSEAIRFKKG